MFITSVTASAAAAAVRTSVHVHTTRGVQLSPDTLLGYERSGFAVTRALLPPSRVHELRPTLVKALEERRHAALKQKVRVLIGEKEADADAETLDARLRRLPEGSVPFLQCFNVHRHYAPVAELARSLAPTAAQLLGSARVRLYQDSLFQKRPGDGPTRWHADLAMAPLDTNDFVTCWLPLQPVPCEEDGGSALVFAAGSHRDVALPFWHGDPREAGDLSARYEEHEATRDGALEVGDASWHHGWTLHCASGNAQPQPRLALALSYFADGARRLGAGARRPDDEDAESVADWINDVKPGAAARHKLLPVVWPPRASLKPSEVRRRTRRPRASSVAMCAAEEDDGPPAAGSVAEPEAAGAAAADDDPPPFGGVPVFEIALLAAAAYGYATGAFEGQ